ncbi:MAG: VWA domain-containing protein [Planctomycetota bacterium]
MRTHLLLLTLPLLALTAATTAQDAGSTFGHARARELAELGRLPTARDIVVRDIVNYHRHRLPLPRADQDVALDLRFDRSFARAGDTAALQIGYTTKPQGDRALSPPCSVALVVDCSGSMRDRGKMDQVKVGLREFASRLRPDDKVALVAFSDDARVVKGLRPCRDGRWLRDAIDELSPGGSTNLHAGLMLGLRELEASEGGDFERRDSEGRDSERGDDDGRERGARALTNRPRRVVLLTDGIANRGVTDANRILADAEPFTRTAIDISTIGVGENLDIALLDRLARGARGLFHFVADAADVQKIFVQELDALLMPAARHARLEVTLPRGLSIERVLHEDARVRRDGLSLDLPDLNAGATGVVIVLCRVDRDADRALGVDARLEFDGASSGRRTSEAASTTLSMREQGRGEVDLEVQKNHAIAVLAQGLADMADACTARRWADADRALRLAQDQAQRLFSGDDPDLQRVREIVAGHARTLQRYVDRFRDY